MLKYCQRSSLQYFINDSHCLMCGVVCTAPARRRRELVTLTGTQHRNRCDTFYIAIDLTYDIKGSFVRVLFATATSTITPTELATGPATATQRTRSGEELLPAHCTIGKALFLFCFVCLRLGSLHVLLAGPLSNWN